MTIGLKLRPALSERDLWRNNVMALLLLLLLLLTRVGKKNNF